MKTVELEIPDGASRVVILRDEQLISREDEAKLHVEIGNGYLMISIEDDDEHDYRAEDKEAYLSSFMLLDSGMKVSKGTEDMFDICFAEGITTYADMIKVDEGFMTTRDEGMMVQVPIIITGKGMRYMIFNWFKDIHELTEFMRFIGDE